MKSARKMLTTTEAAKRERVSPSTMLRAVQAGKVKSFRTPGGHYRVDPRSLKGGEIADLAWMAAAEREACAKIAAGMGHKDVAQAIRKRGEA